MTINLLNSYTASSGSSGTTSQTLTVTLTNAVSVGQVVVIGTCRTATAGNSGVASISGAGGSNTWLLNQANSTRANNYDVGLHVLPVTSAISASTVLTITNTTGAARRGLVCGVFGSGLTGSVQATSGSYVSAGNVSGPTGGHGSSTIAFNTLATPIPAADMLLINAISYNGTSVTMGDTEIDRVLTTAGSAERGLVLQYDNRTGMTDGDVNSRSAGGTYSSSIVWASATIGLELEADAVQGSVVVSGAKKDVASYEVIVGGAKKAVEEISVIVGGAKKPLA